MKRMVFVAVLAVSLIAAAGSAFAADKGVVTIDGSLIFATSPAGAFDSTIGIGIGALVDVSSRMNFSNKNVKMGIRGDISYFDWDGSYYTVGVHYKRLALFGGPRFTFNTGNPKVAPYVEGGVEITRDEVGVYLPGVGGATASDISLGLAGGGGVDFLLTPNMKLGVNARLHLISDGFMTLGVTLGFLF